MLCMCLEKFVIVLVICIVSLWVGVSIRICGVFSLGLRFCSRGKENVVVFLFFVWVIFRMLWLFSRCGIYFVWIGDGFL